MPVYDENGNIVEVKEPEWSILMFWEDITTAIQYLWTLFKAIFNRA